MIIKPRDFEGTRDAYAVVMPNDCMSPRCRVGDILYIDPNLVKTGDLVIVAQKNSDLRDIVQLVEKDGEFIGRLNALIRLKNSRWISASKISTACILSGQ